MPFTCMETYMNIHETYTGPGSVAMLNVISAIAVLTVATSSRLTGIRLRITNLAY